MECKNFRIKNKLAYTLSRDVLVTNVLVQEIKENVTENMLKNHFENYGEVLALTFNDDDLYNSRSANVCFKNPAAAAKVLNKSHRHFKVTANDVWLQQLLNQKPKYTNTATSLIDLNDDALFHIMSYLTIKDQLALVCCHSRFLPAFEMYAKLRFKELNSHFAFCNLSPYQIQQFFLTAGYNVKKFGLMRRQINEADVCFFQLLQKYCANLTALMISGLNSCVAAKLNKIFAKNRRQLKSLCCFECFIDCVATVSKLPQLEELGLIRCKHVTSNNLRLTHLKEFHLINCEDFDVVNIENALLHMTALRTLSLVEPHNIKDGKLALVVKNLPRLCSNLEVLNLNCSNSSYESVFELSKLRSIHFANFGLNDDDDFLEHFALKRAAQIKTLGIDCKFSKENQKIHLTKFINLRILRFMSANDEFLKSLHLLQSLEKIDLSEKIYVLEEEEVGEVVEREDGITNEGLLELLYWCFNLKYVKIEFTIINNDFTEALLPLIRETKRQFTFFVRGSYIRRENLPEEYSTVEMKKLVKFVFEEARQPFNEDYHDSFNFIY